jgi:hypothetical protein
MFDPTTGRFLSVDPIGFPAPAPAPAPAVLRTVNGLRFSFGFRDDLGRNPCDEVNLYLYCFNNPVNKTDPSGLQTPPWVPYAVGTGGAVVIIAGAGIIAQRKAQEPAVRVQMAMDIMAEIKVSGKAVDTFIRRENLNTLMNNAQVEEDDVAAVGKAAERNLKAAGHTKIDRKLVARVQYIVQHPRNPVRSGWCEYILVFGWETRSTLPRGGQHVEFVPAVRIQGAFRNSELERATLR